MKIGNLEFVDVSSNLELVAKPIVQAIKQHGLQDVLVAEIDPEVSDTAAFCEKYDVGLDVSVNCVIVEAKRGDKVWYAACLIPANVRADINGIVRRVLDAKKLSFAPMDKAVEISGMAYGAISPIGLPADWPILVDSEAAKLDHAIIGAGVRQAKLLVSGELLANLPNAKVLSLAKSQ